MESSIFIRKISKDSFADANVDAKTEWMNAILEELSDGVESADFGMSVEMPEISFKGTLERVDSNNYGEYVLLAGVLKAKFYTICGKTGTAMVDSFSEKIRSVFLDQDIRDKYHLEEEVSLYLDDSGKGQEYDIYYIENNKIDIGEALREYALISKNPYPSLP